MLKMTMPSVHKCALLFSENDNLKLKVKKLSKKNKELTSELHDACERLKAEEILKKNRSISCVSTQTEVEKTRTGLPVTGRSRPIVSRPSTSDEKRRADKLMQMHNNLMKRYEKEVQVNTEHSDTIDKLNLRIGEQDRLLEMTKARLHEAERENERLRNSQRSRSRSRGRSSSPADSDVAGKELDRLRTENQRLKKELSGLDKNFFEELEDLKFGFQQSSKLNQEYEKTLKSLCNRFDIPFPPRDLSVAGKPR